MDPSPLPRFEATQRRAFLKGAAAVTGLALFPGVLAACGGTDDKDTFADASSTSTSATSTTTTTGPASGDGSTTSTTTTSAPSGDALPVGAALEVAFTFGVSGGGGFGRNPYVAVWIESAGGDLVANLGVWYDAPKGNRWINNLGTWYSAVSSTSSDYLETTTSATRPAGSYSLSWDGTDVAGARADQGDYVVYVEAAQEHGEHSLTSAPLTLGTAKAAASLPDDGDLSAASATYTA